MSGSNNLILFGAPGAGKGTQSKIIVKKLHIPIISMGDMLRDVIKQNSKLADEVRSCVESGRLVSDEITGKLLKNRIEEADCLHGFILDGYPRNLSQAIMLDSLNVRIDKFIYINLLESEVLKRLGGRRICKACGEVFHIDSKKSKIDGICDFCGAELVLRADDRVDVIKNRLKIFNGELEQLKKFYCDRGKFFSVDGNGEIDDVTSRLLKVIER